MRTSPASELPAFLPIRAQQEEIIAEYHRLNGQRVSRGMRLVAERGDHPGCAPLGYANRRNGYRAYVETDPAMAPLVREAFELAANGYSLGKILAKLGPKGLRSRNGKLLGASSLQLVLKNPFYTGKFQFGGEQMPGNHAPIVEMELSNLVQQVLNSRRKR